MDTQSSSVQIYLVLEDLLIPVARLRRGFLIVSEPFEHPPADGELIIRIEPTEHHVRVRLPQGMSPDSQRVNFIREPVARPPAAGRKNGKLSSRPGGMREKRKKPVRGGSLRCGR